MGQVLPMVVSPHQALGKGPEVPPATPTAHVPTSDKIVFAHRGLNHQAPENTIPAFQLAADAGAKWIETDVDILKDGTAIVIHDSTLDRTTDHSGGFYNLTVDDLGAIDAGAWFGPEYEGTKIPTLKELVEFLNRNKLNANIELKQHETGKEGTLRMIDSVIADLDGLDDDREVIVSSFSPLVLEHFHERAPQYAIGMLWENVALHDDWLSVLEFTGASYVHAEDKGLTRERVQAARDAGYGVNVWTVNDAGRANQLFNWGCTGVFTDVADQF